MTSRSSTVHFMSLKCYRLNHSVIRDLLLLLPQTPVSSVYCTISFLVLVYRENSVLLQQPVLISIQHFLFHQVMLLLEAAWKKSLWHFYTWPELEIRPQTFQFWVPSPIHIYSFFNGICIQIVLYIKAVLFSPLLFSQGQVKVIWYRGSDNFRIMALYLN